MDCLILNKWMDEDTATKTAYYSGCFFIEPHTARIFPPKKPSRESTLLDAEKKEKPQLTESQMAAISVAKKERQQQRMEIRQREREKIGIGLHKCVWTEKEKQFTARHLSEYAEKGIDSSWRRRVV